MISVPEWQAPVSPRVRSRGQFCGQTVQPQLLDIAQLTARALPPAGAKVVN